MDGANRRVRRLEALGERDIESLADVLSDCVEGGASIGFMAPFTRDDARRFFGRIARMVDAGERAILAASDEQGICGSVQLILNLPDNQPHRAEVTKMLVHRRARRQGVGAALVRGAESLAVELGRTVLTLDAVTGGDAARLYERMGWERVGDVPDFALFPDGRPCSTTYYHRRLGERG